LGELGEKENNIKNFKGLKLQMKWLQGKKLLFTIWVKA
jgi:hypothetical protein